MTQTQNPSTGPDISQIPAQTLPEKVFPGGRNQPYRVFFQPEAHSGVWTHATDFKDIEICGVLVGSWAKDADGPYLFIEHFIRGESAQSKMAEVTFTHETWSKIHQEMDSKYSHLSIVGWYHSHPDFGIFLSDRDRFIHDSFFNLPGQVAHVVDPVRKTEGVFIWQQGKPALAPNFWVGNQLFASIGAGDEATRLAIQTAPSAGMMAGLSGTSTPMIQASQRVPGYVRFLELFLGILLLLSVFFIGFTLKGWLGVNEAFLLREEQIQKAKREAEAHTFYEMGIQPGMDVDVAKLQHEITTLAEKLDAIADETIKAAPEDSRKELQEKWQAIGSKLKDMFHLSIFIARRIPTDQEVREMINSLHARKGSPRRISEPPLPQKKEDPKPVEKKEDPKPDAKQKTDPKPEEKKTDPKKTDGMQGLLRERAVVNPEFTV